PKLFFRDVRRIIVTPAFSSPVAREMLHTREYAIRSARLGTLESSDLRTCDRRAEIWVLACAFHHAPPTCVSGNIDHRSEGPLNSRGAGLSRGDTLRMLR